MRTIGEQMTGGGVPASQACISVQAWKTLTILVLLYLVAMIDRSIISMLIGPIKRDLALGDFQASLLMGTAFGLCYVAFGLPFGWASDRFPRPLVIFVGMSFWSLACASGGVAAGFAGLFISRMLVGAGEASLSPSAYSLIAENFPRQKISLAMAIYHYGGSVGGAMALLIGGIVAQWTMSIGSLALPWIGELRSWQIGFLVVGLPGMAIALLALLLHEPRSAADGKQEVRANAAAAMEPLIPFLKQHRLLTLCHFCGFALALLVIYANSFWLPELILRDHGWEPGAVGGVLAVKTLGSVLIGQIAAVRLVGYYTKKGYADASLRAFLWALGLGIVASILAFATKNVVMLIIGSALSAACLHPVMTYGSSALQLFVPPRLRGRMSGLFLSLTSLMGLGLGPALVGFVTQYVFQDEALLRFSLLAVSIACQLLAMALLLIALPQFRAAVRAQERTVQPGSAGREP